MKSYYFETLFYRTFFLVSVWFHTKSPIIAEYAWEQHAKRGAADIEKRPWLYSKYRCIEKSLRHFLQNYISCDLISWDFISSRQIILGKSPMNLKLRTLFFPRTPENWDFFTKVFFQVFFLWLFFNIFHKGVILLKLNILYEIS